MPKVLVLQLPVRVNAAWVYCVVCVARGQTSEGNSVGEEASIGV